MMEINGGFPPIRYTRIKKEIKRDDRTRFFATPVKNLDIRNILTLKKKQPVINLEQKDVNVIDSL